MGCDPDGRLASVSLQCPGCPVKATGTLPEEVAELPTLSALNLQVHGVGAGVGAGWQVGIEGRRKCGVTHVVLRRLLCKGRRCASLPPACLPTPPLCLPALLPTRRSKTGCPARCRGSMVLKGRCLAC